MADETSTEPGAAPGATTDNEPEIGDFDTWMSGQDEATQTLVANHYDDVAAGLKSALKNERQSAKTLGRQLKELTKTSDGETLDTLRNKISGMGAEIALSESRAEFIEQCASPGVGCNDLKLAWIAAQNEDGSIMAIDELKEAHPSLFSTPTAPAAARANAGNGTAARTASTAGPNDWLQAAVRNGGGRVNIRGA